MGFLLGFDDRKFSCLCIHGGSPKKARAEDCLVRSSEPAHKPTERKRDGDGRIGPVLDILPNGPFEASGLAPDDGSRIAGRFAGLSVELLGRAYRLLHRPFDLALDVSGGFSEALFELAAR